MKALSLILNILIYIVVVLISIVLILIFISPDINPNTDLWWVSCLALFAPIIVFISLIISFILLAKFRLIGIIPLLILAAFYGRITTQMNIPFSKDYYTKNKGDITVVSYNVRGFYDKSWNHNNTDSIIMSLKEYQPDIILFQEFKPIKEHKIEHLVSDSLAINDSYINMNSNGNGTAIFSRYPIIKKGSSNFEDEYGSVQWADIIIRSDTIRVFNLHLKVSGLDMADRELLSYEGMGQSIKDSVYTNEFKNIIKKVNINNIKRSFQADSVAALINKSPFPVIVGGDLNDVPLSYTYKKVRGDLLDTFQEKGRGYGYTFNDMFSLLRIDYIFYDNNKFKTLNYISPKMPWSDHNPVIVYMSN